jgi:hypothetical protein
MKRLLPLLLLSACATPGPLDIEVAVSDLGDDEKAMMDEQLCALPDMLACTPKSEGQKRVYEVQWGGTLKSLQQAIARFPSPGLEPATALVFLEYVGYDNLPPEIEFVSPVEGVTVTETSADVVVAVTGDDVERVTIDGSVASQSGKGLYKLRLQLKEGENVVKATAIDDADNEAVAELVIIVDTTPPDVNAIVKVVIEGTVEPGSRVFVDGRAVSVGPFGAWRTELTVRRGKTSVEVVAIDANGNKKTERRSLFE